MIRNAYYRDWMKQPEPWQPPADLNDDDRAWLGAQLDLAGKPMPKPPPPRKVNLDHPYRKPHGWDYVEERSIGDPAPRYIKTYRL